MDTTRPTPSPELLDPREAVLRLIARAAPRSWFPRMFAKERQADLNQVYLLLELLQLEGLIERGESDPAAGPGVILTPAGKALLNDPDKLARLRAGEPLVAGDRGGEVRQVLSRPPQAPVTRLLVFANIAVFAVACLLAWSIPGLLVASVSNLPGSGMSYVLVPEYTYLTHITGDVTPRDIVQGQWWRLLTCCFVHFGLLHLGMNMWGLWVIGRYTEAMWGSWRFLLIYLIAGWGGSCIGQAYEPTRLAGASGAICGVLTAEAAWFFLNRRLLPRSSFRRFATGFMMNVVLLVVISTFPNVSWLGHLGGALFGLAAAVLLHFQRYGPPPLRWPALVVTLLLPVLALLPLTRNDPQRLVWIEKANDLEERCFQVPGGDLQTLSRTLRPMDRHYSAALHGQLDRNPMRRDAEKARAALADLEPLADQMRALEKNLDREIYHAPDVVAFRQASRTLAQTWLRVITESQRCLRAGDQWTGKDERTLQTAVDARDDARKAWADLLAR